MTQATLCALLLLAAGLLHSASFMCRKLPAARRPAWYPKRGFEQTLLDLAWICLLGWALGIAFGLSTTLGLTAAALYFLALPFALQPPMARLLGFRSLRHYLDRIDRGQG
jgi:hypothetical protein